MSEEYGLTNLGDLPLLEQVHRLYHAIQMNYPYKETRGWKSLTSTQKQQLLRYIQVNRDKLQFEESIPKQDDPYLALCAQQNERATPPSGSVPKAYEPPKGKLSYYKRHDTKWRIVDEEYLKQECSCGDEHVPILEDGSPMLVSIGKMMTIFGDVERPCSRTAKAVLDIVERYYKSKLKESIERQSITMTTIAELFPSQVEYYCRWLTFKTKADTDDMGEKDDNEELAEELDDFAYDLEVMTGENCVHGRYKERLNFADERTDGMGGDQYQWFARVRLVNFLKEKGKRFKEWLGIANCKRTTLDCLNFVIYDGIGELIETAIKQRNAGRLQSCTTPLLVKDIQLATRSVFPETRVLVKRSSEASNSTGSKRLKRLR